MNSMKVLIVGDDPHILTLAYYMAMLNQDLDVTVAYTIEGKKFRDDIIELEPIHSIKSVESIGCSIVNLKDIRDIRNYDLVIDFMTYKVEDYSSQDYIRGFGFIEYKLSKKYGIPIFPEDSDIDSDVRLYLEKRNLISKRLRELKIYYGIKHVDDAHIYLGYGATSRLNSIETYFKNPLNIYRHVLYTSIIISFRRSLEEICKFPTWDYVVLKNSKIMAFKFGPTSHDVLKLGISPTSISLTSNNTYMKVITIYGRFPIAFQCVGDINDVTNKLSFLYSFVLNSIENTIARLVAIPSVCDERCLRSWVDHILEIILRESYWINVL